MENDKLSLIECLLSTYNYLLSFFQHLEEYCIQDLMFHAVHTQRSGPNSMPIKLLKVSTRSFKSLKFDT